MAWPPERQRPGHRFRQQLGPVQGRLLERCRWHPRALLQIRQPHRYSLRRQLCWALRHRLSRSMPALGWRDSRHPTPLWAWTGRQGVTWQEVLSLACTNGRSATVGHGFHPLRCFSTALQGRCAVGSGAPSTPAMPRRSRGYGGEPLQAGAAGVRRVCTLTAARAHERVVVGRPPRGRA